MNIVMYHTVFISSSQSQCTRQVEQPSGLQEQTDSISGVHQSFGGQSQNTIASAENAPDSGAISSKTTSDGVQKFQNMLDSTANVPSQDVDKMLKSITKSTEKAESDPVVQTSALSTSSVESEPLDLAHTYCRQKLAVVGKVLQKTEEIQWAEEALCKRIQVRCYTCFAKSVQMFLLSFRKASVMK